jgi:uncharacterized protein (DUF302 family)
MRHFISWLLLVAIAALTAVLFLLPSLAADLPVSEGMISVRSAHSVAETASRLETLLEERNLTLMAQVDHAANAASVDQDLRPTRLFIFGNPNAGTPLMQCSQTVGIDLPQKALIWQDAEDRVWFSYNRPDYLVQRHDVSDCADVATIEQALFDLAQTATSR